MALSPNLILEKNKIGGTHPWIVLLEVYIDEATTIRLARNTEDIDFNGNKYIAFPFMLDPIKQSAKGQIASVALKISNVTRYLQPYIESTDGGIGIEVKLIVINTGCQDSADLDAYEELAMYFSVVGCNTTSEWVTFTLGAPNPLIQRYPLDRYTAEHCRHHFKDAVCGYVPKSIASITLTPDSPVSITTTAAHGFLTGDVMLLQDVEGTVELNNKVYTVTKVDDTIVTLQGTDGSDFSAHVPSTGKIGFSGCNRNLHDCYARQNASRFGGFPGLRTGGVRFA